MDGRKALTAFLIHWGHFGTGNPAVNGSGPLSRKSTALRSLISYWSSHVRGWSARQSEASPTQTRIRSTAASKGRYVMRQ